MIKEYLNVFKKGLLFIDLAIVTACFFASYFLRELIGDLFPIASYIWLLPILLVIWGLCLTFFGGYESFRTKGLPEIVMATIKSAIAAFMIFSTITYAFKIHHISRLLVLLMFLLSAVSLVIEKIAVVNILRHIRRKGYNYRGILIVGTGPRAKNFINLIHQHAEWGLKVVGLVDYETQMVGQTVEGYKVIGVLENIPEILHGNVIDEVVFIIPRSKLNLIEQAMLFCESEGVKVTLAVDYFELQFARARQTELEGFPLLTFESTPDKLWRLVIKRALDIVLSLMGIVMVMPILIAAVAMIKSTSPGPIFFKQKRCGRHGRTFNLYKFRTMVVGAEDKLKDLLKYNEMTGPAFKMDSDPRVTKVGKFLRKTSIDELPQLWNVLRGDMSLVGPRPPIPDEINKYEPWQRRRLSMRPGITCLWQIEGRNRITDFNEWMNLDLKYIDNWSLWLDFKILLKTVPVVLFGVGAK